jgi:hypothetical protein
VAEKAAKAREIPIRLRQKMTLNMGVDKARSKLNKLSQIEKPDFKTQKEIKKLANYLQKNEQALENILANSKLSSSWKKYQELLKGSHELPAGSMVSPARFMRYRALLMNAAKYGGVAGVVFMIHSFENAENKADFIGQFAATSVGIYAGVKLAKMGFRAMPGPIYAKAIAGAIGLAGGFVGAHYLESAYNYGARTVGDRFLVNRGQSKGWETLGSGLEVVGGVGIGNFAELFNFYDVWNNVDLDEVIDEQGNLNPLAYQNYLSASAVDALALKRHFYRDYGSWDHEMNQLTTNTEKVIEKLKKEIETLNPDSEQFDQKQSDLERLEEAVALINRKLRIRIKGTFNKEWDEMQKAVIYGEGIRLSDQGDRLVEKLPSHLRSSAAKLILKIEERIINKESFIIDSDNPEEEKLWLRLRDAAPIKIAETNEEGEMVEHDYTFPEWYLQFKSHLKRRFVYEQIRDFGKLPDIKFFEDKKKPKKPEKPSKEGAIEIGPNLS